MLQRLSLGVGCALKAQSLKLVVITTSTTLAYMQCGLDESVAGLLDGVEWDNNRVMVWCKLLLLT
jgi:hypothetical protein